MLTGILVALATPFTADGEHLDEQAAAELVRDLIADGVHGIVVGGSTGEFFSMTPAERQRVLEIVVQVANGRVPVIAHTGSLSTTETIALSQHAEAAGADMLMVVPSYYERLTDRELITHFQRVGAATKLPIMLYNIPSACSTDVTPDLVAKIAEVCDAQYVKDSSGDMHRIFQIGYATGGRVVPVSGADTLALQALAWGTQAAVWGAANATTRECVALYKLVAEKKDLEGAGQLWGSLLPVMNFLETRGYIASVKAAAELCGRRVGSPRAPILPLAEADRVDLQGLLDGLKAVAPLVDRTLAQ